MRLCLIPLKILPRNPPLNLQHFKERMEQLVSHRPDLVCLPECAFTGYLYEEADFDEFAEPIPGPTTAEMAQIARKYGVFLCFGMLERASQGVYNSAVLLGRQGDLLLVHRKLVEQPPFINGERVESAETEFGRLCILICGDLFHEEAIEMLGRGVSLLLVPMARGFDGQSPDVDRWMNEERPAYLEAVKRSALPAVIVNAYEPGCEAGSFGGALLVDAQGNLLAEAPHGTDDVVVYDFEELE